MKTKKNYNRRKLFIINKNNIPIHYIELLGPTKLKEVQRIITIFNLKTQN